MEELLDAMLPRYLLLSFPLDLPCRQGKTTNDKITSHVSDRPLSLRDRFCCYLFGWPSLLTWLLHVLQFGQISCWNSNPNVCKFVCYYWLPVHREASLILHYQRVLLPLLDSFWSMWCHPGLDDTHLPIYLEFALIQFYLCVTNVKWALLQLGMNYLCIPWLQWIICAFHGEMVVKAQSSWMFLERCLPCCKHDPNVNVASVFL
jgi:hypothetical protein